MITPPNPVLTTLAGGDCPGFETKLFLNILDWFPKIKP